jgi:hypothetical protein
MKGHMHGASATYRPIYLDEPMRFGKYKGSTIREIMAVNPEYVTWMIDTQIQLADDAFEYYTKLTERV